MVKVIVVGGTPEEWGRLFTELVCRIWYGREEEHPRMEEQGYDHWKP